ncbi:GNAT family N-acetyltransferase [Streptomyces armeniacus]|uniref:GNAT family N-acetyltransferase n=1 Tax=Streptomyces armeniacus TaxID=83291 RepID=UPI001FEBB69E|nr:GNAT family protein [Streptomyces armeniacus]
MSLWRGESVLLRGFQASDWEYFQRFEENSEDARSVYRVVPPRSAEGHRRETEELAAKPVDEEEFALAVESLSGKETVGAISTFGVDRRAGHFRYGVAIDRAHRHRGYATEAVGIVLDYMFLERRFHKCVAEVYAFNRTSLAFHGRLGFVREGLLREHEFFRGARQDVVVLGLLAAEHRHGGGPG